MKMKMKPSLKHISMMYQLRRGQFLQVSIIKTSYVYSYATFTSRIDHARSDDDHGVEILAAGRVCNLWLYNLP